MQQMLRKGLKPSSVKSTKALCILVDCEHKTSDVSDQHLREFLYMLLTVMLHVRSRLSQAGHGRAG